MLSIISSRTSLAAILVLVQSVASLQFMLLTEQPMCINITPKSIVKGLQINYVITGINEN